MAEPFDPRRYWDDAYRSRGVEGVSWFQRDPGVSLELIRLLGVEPPTPVVDVGGGASTLVDRLVASGFDDVSVLDVSEVALKESRRRLGASQGVTWLHEDVLAWRPERRFGLWHDRAVFHFLTEEKDRQRYLATLAEALAPGGGLVMGTFAEDGPEYCSGLPVARYSGATLAGVLGGAFTVVGARRELHVTPAGVTQPFTWVAARMAAA